MTKEELRQRIRNACDCVIASEAELTDIDSRFGDADHGLTMTKIGKAIKAAAEESEGGIQTLLDDCAMAVLSLSGGSAVPLWNAWLDGLQEEAPEEDEIDIPGLRAVFAKGLEEFEDMSGAAVGDKTILDALKPATDAITSYDGSDAQELFSRAAAAAAAGAEATKEFTAKFGRAKSYGAKTIGTPDAGALSMSRFFEGLAKPL
ncbi:MAG: DAK2 domain-containing protein [Clostridium sp.]|nr:DAK2 domain-containing protein [Clostridium sp.]MBP3216672.1 DAK2 domain-containing protein [Clostridium sp.]